MLAQQTISADVTGLLTAFMRDRDIHAPEVLHILTFEKDKSAVTYQQWWDALALLGEVSNIEHIGLELGKRFTPEYSGIVGYLSLSATNLKEAATHFEHFHQLLASGTSAKIERRGDTICCQWLPAYCSANKDSDETLIAALVSFARSVTGNNTLSPLRIGFMHHQPLDISQHNDFFCCEVLFGCPALFIEVPIALGDILSTTSNPTLGAILQQQAQSMLDTLPSSNDLIANVRQCIVDSFLPPASSAFTQSTSELPTPELNQELTQDNVAIHLGISSRTLHRKLAEKGIRFSTLLQEVRYQLAKQYLDEGKFSISAVSHILGYSEQSAFTRAFKKWSGMTPIAYVKRP